MGEFNRPQDFKISYPLSPYTPKYRYPNLPFSYKTAYKPRPIVTGTAGLLPPVLQSQIWSRAGRTPPLVPASERARGAGEGGAVDRSLTAKADLFVKTFCRES